MTLVERFWKWYAEYGYQFPTSGVHTFGPCSTEGCRVGARGSRTCSRCLQEQLHEFVPTHYAERIIKDHFALTKTIRQTLDVLELYDAGHTDPHRRDGGDREQSSDA